MANKKISELESRASLSLSDLMAVGDPSTGYLYKTTISDLKTLTGAGVVSFNGRFGTVNPAEGDYTLTQLGDVIITSAANNDVLKYNGSNWVNTQLYTGTVAQYIDGTGAYQTFPTLLSSDRLVTNVRNTSGATITKGTVVYLNGSSGTLPTIAKAQANAESTSTGTYGVVQDNIANNANGYVVVIGNLTALDTSAFNAGDILWLSPTVAGGYTTTKPVAPNHAVYVGIVTRSSNTQGTIEVKIQNGYELDELHNVLITSVANNDVLVYETASSLWKNKAFSTLSTDTLDSVTGRGNTTANSITVGSVSAAGLSNLLGQIRTFATTGNTYIGATPGSATDAGYKLDVNGTIRSTGAFYGTQLLTGSHSFRDQMYITATTDGWTKQNAYNAASAFALGFVGDLRFAPSAAIKAVFSFNGSYSNNGTIYHGDSSLIKIFTGDAMGNTIGATNINGYGINLMPTLNYTTGTSNFTGIYYNPTLTATTGLTHYAMNLVAGLVRMGTLAGTGSRMVVADSAGNLSTQAIPDLTGYVTLDSFQTITASKTFSVGFSLASAGGSNQLTSFANANSIHSGSAGSNIFGFNNSNNIYFGKGLSNGGVIAWNNSVVRSYTLPNADGTLALTSDIPSVAGVYLPLSGGTLTGALNGTSATFSGDVQGANGYFSTKVGIGTNNYVARLNVQTTDIRIEFDQINSTTGYLEVLNPSRSVTNYFSIYNRGFNVFTRGGGNGSYVQSFTIADNGAATFSSSVTAGGTLSVASTSYFGSDMFTYANGGIFFNGGGNYGTGVLQNSDGSLNLQAGGTIKVKITSGGDVGIGGTPTAGQRLNVFNTTDFDIKLRKLANGGTVGILFETANDFSGTSQAYIKAIGSGNSGLSNLIFGTSSAVGNTSASEMMRISSNGNVGINTTNPIFRLDVNGNARFIGGIETTNATRIFSSGNDIGLQLDVSDGSYGALIQATNAANSSGKNLILNRYGGNVGVYTTSPSATLHVNGDFKTAAPTGGTAQSWKLGEDTGTLYTATRTIKVEIAGSIYYLLAVKSSDL